MKQQVARNLLFTVTILSQPLLGFLDEAAAQGTPQDFKIAFLADQGQSANSTAVLNLIKNEGTDAVVHAGDFDYKNDPDGWDRQINDILGLNFPYFACLGEDDESKFYTAGGYQDLLEARMNRLGITWDGDLAVKSSFSFNGIFFVQTASGVEGSGHEDYIRDKLAADNSIWRISTFHKNMKAMQLCGMSNSSGWDVYEESRKGGAFTTNGQCHAYGRTHLLSNVENQTVASTSDTLVIAKDEPGTPEDEGRNFHVLSGLGGKSKHGQENSGPWWAVEYTNDQDSQYGALFGTYNYNGNPRMAMFYFKNIDGDTVDTFYVLSTLGEKKSLAVNTVGSGSVTLDPPGGIYPDSTVVTLTATPSPGWDFTGWGGDLAGTQNPDSILVDDNKSVTATFSQPPGTQTLVMISGNNQTDIVGSTLPDPFVVKVLDVDSNPVGGVPITFQVAAGGGTLSNGQPQLTDGNGEASTVLTLGFGPGTNTVAASSAGLVGSPQTFNATAISGQSTIAPTDDAYVRSTRANSNYGSSSSLQLRQSSATYYCYLKFVVSGIFDPIQSAKIRLEVTDESNQGGSIYLVSNDYAGGGAWDESGITWNNAPPITGVALSSVGAVLDGQIVEFDLGSAVSGNGTFSFALATTSSDRVKYATKEKSGTLVPELVLDLITLPIPNISSFSPGSGALGSEITLSGFNFSGTTTVAFNGTSGSFTVDSDTQLRATVPTGATSGKIAVTNLEGTGESSGDFTVIAPPTISSLAPASGPISTEVTISGSSLTGTTAVSFGGTAANSFSVDSDSQVRAVVAAGTSTGVVTVTNVAGTATSSSSFAVTNPPVVNSLSPDNGPVGVEVTIAGLNFTGTSAVLFNGTAAVFVEDSDTQLRANVPAGATSGKIQVTNSDGAGESGTDFNVILPPTIASFVPPSGPVATEVTLTGSSFNGASDVRFGGLSASSFSVDSDSQIRAEVPLGASDGKITVANIAGTGSSSADFDVTPPPSTFTVSVSHDAYVRSDNPTGNYGTAGSVQLKQGSTVRHGYLKFVVSGLAGPVQSATVRVFVIDDSPSGGSIYQVSNDYEGTSTPWDENGLNWNNAPAISGTALGSVGSISVGDTVEFDVTSAISGNGIYSFGFQNGSSNRVKYESKEKGEGNPPELAIEIITSPVPIISSLSPTSGVAGSGVTLFGNNFTGTSDVSFNGTQSGSFTVDSDTQLRADVPIGAGTGKIAVTNTEGSGQSTEDFTVIVAPAVVSFSPESGPVGTEVTLAGGGFTGASGVSFGGVASASFSVDSDSQLRAVVAAGTSTGPVSVTNSAGIGTSSSSFLVTTPPVVNSFSPGSGPAGLEVTIAGLNFTGTSAVLFNGTAAVFVEDSDTQLRANVPAGATSGKIQVTNSDGAGESGTDFNVILPPTIASFAPSSGPVGTEVTLTGSSFTGATNVLFNGVSAATFTVDSDSQLRAEVPVGASDGKIAVENIAGTGSSSADFDVTPPPSTSTVSVSHDAYVRSDNPTGNYGTAGSVQLKQGSTVRHGYLKFVVSGLAGPVQSATVRIFVTDDSRSGGSIYQVSNDYEGTNTPWDENGLNWNNAPAISGTALGSVGSVSVGDTVEFDVTSAVSGNGTYSFGFTNNSGDRVKYESKDGGGSNAPELLIDIITSPVPIVSSMTPTSGIVGSQVTLQGANFTGTTDVSFNGSAAGSFSVDSDNQLRVDVPSGASSGTLAVTNAEGEGQSSEAFSVIFPPTVSSFTPVSGPVGTEVTVTGTEFSWATAVDFGGVAASSFTVDSDSQLRATAANGTSTGPITVTNAAGTATSTSDFTVTLVPAITTFTPMSGQFGQEVTITGINFTGTTGVSFNGVASTNFMEDSDTEVRADVPAGASTGRIQVTNADGTGESAQDFTVIVAPTISSFTPTSGPVGTEVTVSGSGLTGATDVLFNGVSAGGFTLDSDNQLRADVPAAASTGPISVTNAAGTSNSALDFDVTAPPSSVTFLPMDDSYVKLIKAGKIYGAETDLRVKKTGSDEINAYLKFAVTGVGGSIQSATLRLTVKSGSVDGGEIYSVSNNYLETSTPWDESDLNWNKAPVISGAPLSSVGVVNDGEVVEFDVTAAIAGDGTYSFAIKNNSSDTGKYRSKESSSPPELVIETPTSPAPAGDDPLARSAHGDYNAASSLASVPEAVSIVSVYPNPFNLETIIAYSLPEAARVRLAIFNLKGQIVQTLVRGFQPAGNKQARWNGTDEHGRDVASGTYLVRLDVASIHLTRKLTLIK